MDRTRDPNRVSNFKGVKRKPARSGRGHLLWLLVSDLSDWTNTLTSQHLIKYTPPDPDHRRPGGLRGQLIADQLILSLRLPNLRRVYRRCWKHQQLQQKNAADGLLLPGPPGQRLDPGSLDPRRI